MKKFIGIALAFALILGVAAASTSAAPVDKIKDGGIVLYGADPGTGGM